MPLPEFISTLGENQFFGAGFGIFALGFSAQVLKKGAAVAYQAARRRYVTTLEIPISDASYPWMLNWISNRPDASSHLSVRTAFRTLHSGKIATGFSFAPSPGTHFIWMGYLPIKIERVRENALVDHSQRTPFETVTLTTLGNNKHLFEKILTDARSEALKSSEGMTLIFKPVGSEWRQFGQPQRRRPLSSVIMSEGQSERIYNDITKFVSSQQWYIDRGIPHRRGYLLHGPPGCGKTSFITALAGELQYSICILNVGDFTMSDDRLVHFMVTAPPQSIILLEDVDAAFLNRSELTQQPKYQGMQSVTLSGLLNALDGVVSSDARLVFMTTNYIERLDAALLRPGRIDMKEFVTYTSKYQLEKAFHHFFPSESSQSAKLFSETISESQYTPTMAEVQAYFMLYRDNPADALKNATTLVNDKSRSNIL